MVIQHAHSQTQIHLAQIGGICCALAPKKIHFFSSYTLPHATTTRQVEKMYTYTLQINMLFVISLSHNVMTHTNVH